MTISAQEVNKLRQMTGSGMMDCKKALLEANGNFDKAIEFLRKKGQKVSASRADRKTSEGIIFTKISKDGSKGVLVALSCETDFVAKNEAFIALGEEILTCAFDQEPIDMNALKVQNLGELTVREKIIENTGKIGEKLEISSFEKHRPGIFPLFLSQNIAQNDPEKKMPSTAAKAITRWAKVAVLEFNHFCAQSPFF